MASHRAAADEGPRIQGWWDPASNSMSYLVIDPNSGCCALVDPVLNNGASGGNLATVISVLRGQNLRLEWILETHPHSDRLSAARWLRQRLGGRTVIGAHIGLLQQRLRDEPAPVASYSPDCAGFDRLVADRERLRLGALDIDILHTPGHTPACISYVIGKAVFVGDVLSSPEAGVPSVEHPDGDPHQLYRSVRRLLSLPRDTALYPAHAGPSPGHPDRTPSTVDAQRRHNRDGHDGIVEEEFVQRLQGRPRLRPQARTAMLFNLGLAPEPSAAAPDSADHGPGAKPHGPQPAPG